MSTTTIDFLHAKRSSTSGLVLFAIGAIALCAALWLDHNWTAQRAAREAEARQRAQALEQARLVAMKPAPPSPDERRLRSVAPSLRQPWLPVLRSIESVTETPIYLLALSIDPSSGTLRLDGEAPSFEHALAYAQALDEQGLLGPAQLRSHEQAVDPQGRPVTRFTVLTQWSVQ